MIRRSGHFVHAFRLACCTMLVAAVAFACDSSTEPRPGDRGIRVVSGGGQSDTGMAILQPLVVEIRDSAGRIVPGAIVQFVDVSFVAVSPPGQQTFGYFATDVADARGRASTIVRLYGRAGPARLAINVPELSELDLNPVTVSSSGAIAVDVKVRLRPTVGEDPLSRRLR